MQEDNNKIDNDEYFDDYIIDQENNDISAGLNVYSNSRKIWETNDFDRLCKKYDRSYHEMSKTVRWLCKILNKKAETPKVNPRYLKAWEEYNYDEISPVVTSLNMKNNWMWKKIGRISPFQAIHNKMLKDGYWVKSSLCTDKYGQKYFNLTVGYYINPSVKLN
jgi:hypothetical protein